MDHLGIEKFMVLAFCHWRPLHLEPLLRRAPDRIVAAVLAQPSGSRPEMRDLFYETNMKGWGPELVKHRPDITMEMVDKFLTKDVPHQPRLRLHRDTRFVRNCQTPVLDPTDDIPAHPYAVAMEAAMLRAKGRSEHVLEGAQERIPLAVRQIVPSFGHIALLRLDALSYRSRRRRQFRHAVSAARGYHSAQLPALQRVFQVGFLILPTTKIPQRS